MNYLFKFALILFISLPFALYAQGNQENSNQLEVEGPLVRNCSAMDVLDRQLQEDLFLEAKMQDIERFTNDFVANNQQQNQRAVVTIPVVVHVLWKTTTENISDAQVLSQIAVLNEDFRRTNSDRTNDWSQGADTEIEFCMATVDPNGNATNGINRVRTKKRSFGTDDSMKKTARGGVDPWDATQYLNIWVCNLGQGLLGYAQFPGGSPSTDGVVVLYNAFGRVGTLNSTYNLGRTTTHEVGHWLNLRHIWGDGGCSVDDFVSDTPASDGANYGCASGHVSCNSLDMVENYMDYSDDGCMNLFTAGQKARMQACLAGPRSSLLSSTACGGGGPTGPTCSDGTMNGDETGIDCGGATCPACPTGPTCSDGTMNGDETGVDCGGATCPACPTTGPCDDPSNLYSQSRKGGREALLSWNSVSAATSYNVRLRLAGSSSWSNVTTSNTSVKASVTKNAAYEWEVQSVCASSTSGWSASTFTAGTSSRLTDGLGLSVYPNPANRIVTVEFSANVNERVEISIIDMLGKTVNQTSANGNNGSVDFNVNELANGIYLIKVSNTEGTVEVQKLMISK